HNFWIFFALFRNKPIRLISSSNSDNGTWIKSVGVLYFLKRSFVTRFTFTSVVCADNKTAITNSNGLLCTNSQWAFGYISPILSRQKRICFLVSIHYSPFNQLK